VPESPQPPEDDRRFVNNPFARALHPPKPRRTLGQWIALALVSTVGAVIMATAFVLPLAFGWSLLRAHGRIGMVAAGVVVAAIYGLIVFGLLRRLWRRSSSR